MENFVFYSPTKVIFGKGTENNVGAELKSWGATKVLVLYGGASAKKSGLLDRVNESLDKAGIGYVSLGGVQPNPRISLVNEGVKLGRSAGVDFILAVGGGSVIDTAKAAGLALACGIEDAWDIYSGKAVPDKCLAIGSILTISAAGSETSWSSVLSNDENKLKRSFNNDILRPKFAIMNPELTFTLPKYQIACGVVDIMMHTLERYFSTVKSCELTDVIAEGLLKTVVKYGAIAYNKPDDYDAQAELMWAGSLSHNNLTGAGKISDFAAHQLEHELSGMFDVAHGAGLAAVWGSWARYVCARDMSKFIDYAVKVWDCELNEADPMSTALEGIAKTEEYFQSIDMPINIRGLGIGELSEEQIDELAEKCTFFGKRTIGNYQKLDRAAIVDIYRAAK